MAGERVELILELGTEIVTFQIVDLTTEALLLITIYVILFLYTLFKIIQERSDTFECGLTLPLYFYPEINFCFADAAQILDIV